MFPSPSRGLPLFSLFSPVPSLQLADVPSILLDILGSGRGEVGLGTKG